MTNYDYKISAGGRVNLIGEHVDYCGGKVFPLTLSLANTVYVKANATNKINIRWTTLDGEVSLDVDKLCDYKHLQHAKYQAGSAYFWRKKGHKVVGCDMLFDCKVPFGSGLSSSAAIEVSTIVALATVAGEKFDPVEVALCAQQAEREYAGVNCGIMDQYASACGKKDMAILLDCNTLKAEYVPFNLQNYSLVITNCNKPHSLVQSKYNERRQQTESALEILKRHADITCLADLSVDEFNCLAHFLGDDLRARARHVVEECERVKMAEDALKSGDLSTFGQLLVASHQSLKTLYEVTGKELDTLVEVALSHPACIGSRMTGGGFGGCTISLVKTGEEQSFEKYVIEKYAQVIGYAPTVYRAQSADGIIIEKL